MSIKTELLAIKELSNDGLLYAHEVVDWARENPTSALHGNFTWDDAKAADEYRLGQARRLIQLHVVSEDGTPQLVSLSFDRTKDGGYRAVEDVLKSKDLTEIMLADAVAELDRIRQKYERIKALADVWSEVERVRPRRRRQAANTNQLPAA